MANLGPVLTKADYAEHLQAFMYGRPVEPFPNQDDLAEAIKDALETVMDGFPAVAAARLDLTLRRLAAGPVPASVATEREVV